MGTIQCPADAPAWLKAAWKEIGAHELPENRGPIIRRYISLARCGQEGEPWCAIFQNAMLELTGFHGTRNPSSQSFSRDSNFVHLTGPAIGAVTVFWRGSHASGLGHVGMYCGERNGYVWTLGGNEGDMVQVEMLAKQASAFGLVGYFWPKTAAAPIIGPVLVAADIPNHVVKVV